MGRTLLIVFRWGIFLLACVFLWRHLGADKGRVAFDALSALGQGSLGWSSMGLVLLLMVLNWSLEARKWRYLVSPLQRVGAAKALVATIAGTSVALITPNRTGEFLGRVLFLEPAHRVQGAFATALGSIAQFVVTLFAGGMALLLMVLTERALPWPSGPVSVVLGTLTALVTTGTILVYLRPAMLRQFVLTVPVLKRLDRASAVLERFAVPELLRVLLLSMARYVVFTVQFLLLLAVLDSGLTTVDAMLAIPVVYLISTLVPTMMLTELGVRGSSALALMVPLGGAEIPVLLATTLLWSVNVALPALVGSVVLLLARIRTQGPGA